MSSLAQSLVTWEEFVRLPNALKPANAMNCTMARLS